MSALLRLAACLATAISRSADRSTPWPARNEHPYAGSCRETQNREASGCSATASRHPFSPPAFTLANRASRVCPGPAGPFLMCPPTRPIARPTSPCTWAAWWAHQKGAGFAAAGARLHSLN